MTGTKTALDLFAGAGGWDIAAARLWIIADGVENAPAALATRAAAGLSTAFEDVWDGLAYPWTAFGYPMQLASPPCQTFSAAGNGAGRRALDTVLAAIRDGVPEDYGRMKRLAAETDPRTALVLTPLAYVIQSPPELIAWEQVPAVLPVWEACAVVLRGMGYSVATGVLNAEQYGVPQTRRRAILVARRDGHEARLPVPTHSRYHARTPERLDEGVLPWVSMAEALGWGGRDIAGDWVLRGIRRPAGIVLDNSSVGGTGSRSSDAPSRTITSKADRMRWVAAKAMGSGMVERHGTRRPREMSEPAFTVRASAGGLEPGGFRWESRDWPFERPATTVAGDARLGEPGHRHRGPGCCAAGGEPERQFRPDAIRLTVEEAAALQTFPRDFPFQGGKNARMLQVGNAIPPLLAEAVLRELLSA